MRDGMTSRRSVPDELLGELVDSTGLVSSPAALRDAFAEHGAVDVVGHVAHGLVVLGLHPGGGVSSGAQPHPRARALHRLGAGFARGQGSVGMRWESWSQFWAMGGYALYVWGSMGVTALCLVVEVWWVYRSHQGALGLARMEAQDRA